MHKGIVITNISNKEYYNYCLDILSLKSSDYNNKVFEDIIFNFFIIDKSREQYYIDKWSEIKIAEPVKLEKFSNSTVTFFLPLNMNYLTWGLAIINQPDIKIIVSGALVYKIKFMNNGVSEIQIYKGRNKLFTFYDIGFKDNIFIRKFDNHKYYIDQKLAKIVLTTKELATKYLPKIKKEARKPAKFITIDIETIKNSLGILTPYCYSFYDGKIKKSFFTESPKELFDALLRRKYRGYTVYAHNLSKFDLIFLFKHFAKLWMFDGYKVKPIFKDGAVISIVISNDKGVSLTFRDSYLILPSSLKTLAETFKTNKKLIEPVLLDVNLKNEHKKYAQNDYSHYSKDILPVKDFNEWKKLVLEYCENYSIVLHQVLIKFRIKIYFYFFKIDVLRHKIFISI